MNAVSIIMASFAALGAIDLISGNHFKIGKEFEKGMMMLGNLALSMIGMIVLAPLFAYLLTSPLKAFSSIVPIDPSSFIGAFLANDMGGASLSLQLANSQEIGYFNGMIVGSMMGATVSFTLPFVMGTTEKAQRKNILLGLLCGICTVPIGCFIGGIIRGISAITLLLNLTPLLLLAALLILGLLKFPDISVKIFNVVGIIIRVLVIFGLAVGIFEYLTQIDIIPYTAPIEEGADIIFNIAAVMTGAFPLLYIISKILSKPLGFVSQRIGLNNTSIIGFISTLATSVTTFGMMKDMDDRGVILNSAFAVSAAFTLADHLAFTLSFNADYLLAVTVGKIVSGTAAIILAAFIAKKHTEAPQ